MSTLPPMPQRIRDIFNAAFLFRRTFQFPKNTQEFWDACYAEMQTVAVRFNNDPLMLDMLAACCKDIEREMIINKEDSG